MSCRQVRVQVVKPIPLVIISCIRQGIQTLSDELKEAKKKALIADRRSSHNFGKDYIDYALQHGGQILELARAYSRM